mmetsp:Transcript_10609/g.27504  ORF Transcript_10609/g.27504 Transcript_10609/m.27504 type:complete len:340 (+) Transcript_10609:353-1372(+)
MPTPSSAVADTARAARSYLTSPSKPTPPLSSKRARYAYRFGAPMYASLIRGNSTGCAHACRCTRAVPAVVSSSTVAIEQVVAEREPSRKPTSKWSYQQPCTSTRRPSSSSHALATWKMWPATPASHQRTASARCGPSGAVCASASRGTSPKRARAVGSQNMLTPRCTMCCGCVRSERSSSTTYRPVIAISCMNGMPIPSSADGSGTGSAAESAPSARSSRTVTGYASGPSGPAYAQRKKREPVRGSSLGCAVMQCASRPPSESKPALDTSPRAVPMRTRNGRHGSTSAHTRSRKKITLVFATEERSKGSAGTAPSFCQSISRISLSSPTAPLCMSPILE